MKTRPLRGDALAARRRLATRDTVRLENPSERIDDFVPPAAPAEDSGTYPLARSRAVTRRFDKRELEAVALAAAEAELRNALGDREVVR